MKNLKKEDLEKVLENSKTYWICPVTNTKIDSTDTVAIEAHKAGLLKKLAEAEDLKKKQKDLKKLNAEYKNISTLPDMNQWFTKIFQLKFPDLDKSKFPTLSIENTKPFAECPYIGTGKAVIKISHVPHGYSKEFKKLANIVTDTKTKSVYLQGNPYDNPLFQKVFEFQSYTLKRGPMTKVGLEEKVMLDQDTQYQALKRQIKEVGSQLHELKEKHHEINTKMEDIRSKVIPKLTFDNFEKVKSVVAKKKTLR